MSNKPIVLLGSLKDYENACAFSPEMINDLNLFGSLSVGQLENVLARIQPKSFDVAKEIVFSEYTEREAEALWRLFDVFSATVFDDFVDWLASVRANLCVVSDALPQDIWQKILDNLFAIKKFFPLRCIERHIQRERLRTITGNIIRSTNIICDIRPVFDSSHAYIADVFPLTTLKIGYCTQEEDDKVLEIVLSKEHLDGLSAKIEVAKKKLDVLSDIGFANKGQAKRPKE